MPVKFWQTIVRFRFFLSYRKVVSNRLSWLVAHLRIFRLFCVYEGEILCLCTVSFDQRVQNWIVDWSTARNFMVVVPWNSTIGLITYTHALFFSFFQDIQKSTEKQQNLKSQQSEFLSELNKLSDKAKLNGSSINAYQSDIESFQVWPYLTFMNLVH